MAQMVAVHGETGGNVVAVMDVPREHTDRYGILDVTSDDGRLAEIGGLVEKPKPADAPSTLSIIGRYILLPEIFAAAGDGSQAARISRDCRCGVEPVNESEMTTGLHSD